MTQKLGFWTANRTSEVSGFFGIFGISWIFSGFLGVFGILGILVSPKIPNIPNIFGWSGEDRSGGPRMDNADMLGDKLMNDNEDKLGRCG